MHSKKYRLSNRAKKVIEYLLKVKEATKKGIIEETPIMSENEYAVVRNELIGKGFGPTNLCSV